MKRGPAAGVQANTGWGLQTLNYDSMDKIHRATMEVLNSTGIECGSDKALDLFKKGGCRVNKKTKVVKIPEHLVKAALDSCPSQVLLAGRSEENDYMMGGSEVGFTSFGVGVQVEDLDTGKIRETNKQDCVDVAILTDALDHIDVYTGAITARDMPASSFDLHEAEAGFTNCSKHFVSGADNGERADQIIEMAAAVVGGREELRERPILQFIVCPVSPLQIDEAGAETIITSAKNGIPINVLSMAMAGASSPISISGTLVTHNAEILAGVVLAQLASPGAPTIYGSSTTTFDMKKGAAVVGVPELGMISACVSEMSKYYNLPSYVAGG